MTTEPLTIRTYITLTGVAASVTLDLELATYEHIVSEMNDLDNVIIGIDHDGSRYVWSRAAIVSVEANLKELFAAQVEAAERRAAKQAAADAADAAHAAKLTPGTHVMLNSSTDARIYRVLGPSHSGRISITDRPDGAHSRNEPPHHLEIVHMPEIVEDVDQKISDDMDRIMDAEAVRFAAELEG